MNFEIAKEIDEQLYMLAERKKKLDKRIEQREANLRDFTEAHHKSMKRLREKIEKQNLSAHKRNQQFFQEVNYATGVVQDRRNRHLGKSNARNASKSCRQLEQARKNYLLSSEKLMPVYRDRQAMKQLGALHKLKIEKEQAEIRRQASLREIERTHQIQCALEQERRQLMLTLALEERDKLAAVAEERILQTHGKAVDEVIQLEFETFGEEYSKHIDDATINGLRQVQATVESHFAGNRILPSDSLPPPPPRDITASVAENLARINAYNTVDSRGSATKYQQMRVVDQENMRNHVNQDDQKNLPVFRMASDEGNNKTLSRASENNGPQLHHTTSIIVEKPAPNEPYNSADFSEQRITLSQKLDLEEESLKNSDKIRKVAEVEKGDSPNISRQVSVECHQLDDEESVLNISRENQLSSETLPPKPPVSTGNEVPEDDKAVGNVQTQSSPLIEEENETNKGSNFNHREKLSASDKHEIHEGEGQHDSDTFKSPSRNSIKHDISHLESESGATKSDEQSKDVNFSTESNSYDQLFSETPSMVLQSAKKSNHVPSTPKSVEEKVDLSADIVDTLQHSHLSTDEEVKLTKDCSSNQVLQLFGKLCDIVASFTQPVAIRKGYGMATNSRASSTHSPSVNTSSTSVDRQRNLLRAILADRDNEILTFEVEVACALLLRVLSENGEYILPSEILNGVVSLEKICKAHKKLGGGRSDMWNCIITHMTSMISLKHMPRDDLCKMFTNAFVAHIDETERSRFERKVLKTLQLATMPAESSSPVGTPSRLKMDSPAHTQNSFRSDPAPTPPRSPLEESSDRIGIAFGTGSRNNFVAEKKFLSQRATENDKNKVAPGKANVGVAVGNKANSVLNRIQKMSQFDDDEIEDDEVIPPPPEMKYLPEKETVPSGTDDLNVSDEFDFN